MQSAPTWSPDGRKIAFVTTRTDHSFIVVYDMATRTVKYMEPSVDLDSSPMWTADGKSIVYVRRPGWSFVQAAQQAQARAQAGAAAGRDAGRRRGRGGPRARCRRLARAAGGGAQAPQMPTAAAAGIPGLVRATFKGGYTFSFWKADVATGAAKEIWHTQPGDMTFNSLGNAKLAGDYLVFRFNAFGGGRGGGRGQAPGDAPAAPPGLSTSGIATTR